MTELALILVSTVLVNNFVLVRFLGLCPFMGVSRNVDTATGMALATTFVLTMSSVCSYLANEYLLQPLGISPNFLSMLPYLAMIATVTEIERRLRRGESGGRLTIERGD